MDRPAPLRAADRGLVAPRRAGRGSAISRRAQRGFAVSRRAQRGFTLLEMAVVMLVVGILLTLAVPRLPSLGRTELEASADRLASTMTYLADEASLRGRIYRLTLDLEGESWDVAALAPWAERDGSGERPEYREDAEDPMARRIVLPDGVYLDAVLDRDGETSSGTRAIFFVPEGSTESMAVRLGEEGGGSATVRLDAARGSARREPAGEAR